MNFNISVDRESANLGKFSSIMEGLRLSAFVITRNSVKNYICPSQLITDSDDAKLVAPLTRESPRMELKTTVMEPGPRFYANIEEVDMKKSLYMVGGVKFDEREYIHNLKTNPDFKTPEYVDYDTLKTNFLQEMWKFNVTDSSWSKVIKK
jgi:hypothetical protein